MNAARREARLNGISMRVSMSLNTKARLGLLYELIVGAAKRNEWQTGFKKEFLWTDGCSSLQIVSGFQGTAVYT